MKKLIVSALFLSTLLASAPGYVFAVDQEPHIAFTPEGVKAFIAGDASAFAEPLTSDQKTALLNALHAMIKEMSSQIARLQAEVASLKTKSAGGLERSEVTILSPNGGEMFQAGMIMPILWKVTRSPSSGTLTAALVDERGTSTIIWTTDFISDGGAKVTVPKDLSPGYYHLRLSTAPTEDVSDGTFTILSYTDPEKGIIVSGGSGGGGGGGATSGSNGTGGSGGGGGGAPAVTTIEMQPGNDYYFKGPATLQQIKDAGFTASAYPGNPTSQLLAMPNDPPEATDSASATYMFWDSSLRPDGVVVADIGWRKIGNPLKTAEDPSTQPSNYFIIRKDAYQNAPSTFTVPAGVTYFGTTPMNGSPRPW